MKHHHSDLQSQEGLMNHLHTKVVVTVSVSGFYYKTVKKVAQIISHTTDTLSRLSSH